MAKQPTEPFPDANRTELFEVLSHPVRTKILEALRDSPLGFAELKRRTGLESSGHLQFHLSRLNGLVSTDTQGDYVLTDDGREALNFFETVSLRSQAKPPVPSVGRPSARTLLLVSLVTIIILGGSVAYQTYVLIGLESNLQNLNSLTNALYSSIPSSQSFPSGLNTTRISPSDPALIQVAVLMMNPGSQAKLYVGYSIKAGLTLNLAAQVMELEGNETGFSMHASSAPMVSLQASPSNLSGPATIIISNLMTATSSAKAVYFLWLPHLCSGVYLAVGYTLSELVGLHLYVPMFSCPPNHYVDSGSVIGVEGATLVYVAGSYT